MCRQNWSFFQMACTLDTVATTGLLNEVLATTPCPEKKKKAPRAKAAAVPKAQKAAAAVDAVNVSDVAAAVLSGDEAVTAAVPKKASAAKKVASGDAEPKIMKVSKPAIAKIKVVLSPAQRALQFFNNDASALGVYKAVVLDALAASIARVVA